MDKKEEQVVNIQLVSEEVKKKMKAQHGDALRAIVIPKDDMNNEEMEVLVLVPSRSVVGLFLKFNSSDPSKAMDTLIKNCVLTSKEEILSNDGLFYAAASTLSELIPIRQGKLGKV